MVSETGGRQHYQRQVREQAQERGPRLQRVLREDPDIRLPWISTAAVLAYIHN